MKLEHRVTVAAAPDRVWAYLMDLPLAARQIPGIESVELVGTNQYRGRLRVQIGPVRLAFEGDISLEERDDHAKTATLRGEGADRASGGGVRASVRIALDPADGPTAATEIALSTDVQLGGRIAELGQPLIKRKADQVLQAFGENLKRELT